MDHDDAPSSPTPRPARPARPAAAKSSNGARPTKRPASSPASTATRPTKRRTSGTMVVDPPIVAPDAPVSDEPVVLPVIVPAEQAPQSREDVERAEPVEPTDRPTPAVRRRRAPAVRPARVDPDAPPAGFDAPTEAVPLVQVPPATVALPVTDPAPAPDTHALPAVAMPSRSPVQFRRRRPRVRRVTRVIRHVDTWSVFKVALVFNVFVYVTVLVAGVLLWQVAYATGTVDNVENFFLGFGWETFELKGGEIYHNAWIAGLFVTVGLTGLAVFAATLFNLITDLVGGIRVSVLEEEVVVRSERSLLQRVRRDAADDADSPSAAPATTVDPG